jgi:hypothetical protein
VQHLPRLYKMYNPIRTTSRSIAFSLPSAKNSVKHLSVHPDAHYMKPLVLVFSSIPTIRNFGNAPNGKSFI